MVDMNRRGFFKLIAGAAAVVAVPKVLLALEPIETIYCDGVNCDADGLAALMMGKTVRFANPEMTKGIGWRGEWLDLGGNTFTLEKSCKVSGVDFKMRQCSVIRRMNDAAFYFEDGKIRIDLLYLRDDINDHTGAYVQGVSLWSSA